MRQSGNKVQRCAHIPEHVRADGHLPARALPRGLLAFPGAGFVGYEPAESARDADGEDREGVAQDRGGCGLLAKKRGEGGIGVCGGAAVDGDGGAATARGGGGGGEKLAGFGGKAGGGRGKRGHVVVVEGLAEEDDVGEAEVDGEGDDGGEEAAPGGTYDRPVSFNPLSLVLPVT